METTWGEGQKFVDLFSVFKLRSVMEGAITFWVLSP